MWLKFLWKGYRGYSAAIAGKLWLSGKMKSKIGCMEVGGGCSPCFVCQGQTPNLGDLDLVVGIYGGVFLWARQVGISGKLWFMGNGGLKNDEKSVILATTHMVLYPASAGIHVVGSNIG